ncbi:hypothetical protein TDB9533_02726 [Thalassocella blandensis]|nr:hypothetical protein TDB9533_02726 [Thalassocella blandensis]
MLTWRACFSVVLLAFLLEVKAEPAAVQTVKLVMPSSRSGIDKRDDYPIRLLKLALDDARIPYTFSRSNTPMPQSRAIRQVIAGGEINVLWTMTSVQREEEMLPIRIPLFKGLIGWRIFFIHKDNQAVFDKLKNVDELKALTLVQGHDWPDLDILIANGFRTSQSAQYESLFDMLLKKRVQYFPRSVREIWGELAQRHEQDLAVETGWAIHYPTAAYFFVNKNNLALANTLEAALLRIVENGKFEQMFMQEHKQYLDKANFAQRKIIHLDNPLLPPETPVLDTHLWYPN